MKRTTITVGVDGSPASDAALLYALDEASAREAQVRAVTVWWVGPVLPEHHQSTLLSRRSQAAAVSDSAISRAQAELEYPPPVEAVLAHGDAAVSLMDAALHTLCLVIGSEHTGLFQRVTESSTSAQCVRNCAVPVVVVPWDPRLARGGAALSIDLDAGLALDLDRPDLEVGIRRRSG